MTVRAEKRKKAILKAARAVVTDGGFRDLQISTVAAAADVAVGTIYIYFPSKAVLSAELVSSISQRELDVVREIAASGENPETILRLAVRTFCERAFRSGRLAYAIIAEPVDPEVEDVRLRYRAEFGRVFAGILAAGVSTGAFECRDLDTASVSIVGAFMEGVIGSPCAPSVGTSQVDLATSIEQIADFCIRGVSTRPSAEIVLLDLTARGA